MNSADYLRDNMAFSPEASQRELAFIVDEVDSILIDEARTPLSSGPAEDSSKLYKRMNVLVLHESPLRKVTKDKKQAGDYSDEKHRSIELTEEGHEAAEEMLLKDGLLEEVVVFTP